ncbi:hypothetical protein H0H81_011087 [Sphagnurus paluster]|uniref:Uncharacterized protein n=1 Tax=Sphagnurus paluster TaxID=117069 RepID=A0A9P7FP02_9AGAR|nr:hypothetical protein H0H81_011087 [Sphagnurus paluster]
MKRGIYRPHKSANARNANARPRLFSVQALLGKERPRLYMALYWKGAKGPDDVNYHTALLLLPKILDPSSERQQRVRRYHIVNGVREDGTQRWDFKPEHARPRSYLLRGLVFLGKLQGDVVELECRLERVLERVPIVQEDPAWRCHHWTWAAITGLIDPLPSPAERVWETAVMFVDSRFEDSTTISIPTCTTAGRLIKPPWEGG